MSIDLVDLRVAYGRKEVLQGVNCSLPAGKVIGYLGRNGAGKTTTIKVLTGQLSDYGGSARVFGLELREHRKTILQQIGYVPESNDLYDWLTVDEILELTADIHEIDAGKAKRRAERYLEGFALLDVRSQQVASLSKGMRRKLLITAAMLHQPQVLFLDEPLAGLDVPSVSAVKLLMTNFTRAGGTVFYCSHVLDVVEKICDQVLMLHAGRIVLNSSMEQVRKAGYSSLEQLFQSLSNAGTDSDRPVESPVP